MIVIVIVIGIAIGTCRQQYGERPSVETIANVFQKVCYENKDALSAGIIVAGWDKQVGPSVYNIPLGGGLFRQPWAIGGAYIHNITYLRLLRSLKLYLCRLWFYVCVWLLRCYLSGELGTRRDCQLRQKQSVIFFSPFLHLFPLLTSLILSISLPSPRTRHVARRVLRRCHPHVRHHRGRSRAVIRTRQRIAAVLGRKGGVERCEAGDDCPGSDGCRSLMSFFLDSPQALR